MTLHLLARRRRTALAAVATVAAVAAVLPIGTGTAYAAPGDGTAPTLNVRDGDWWRGTVELVSDATTAGDSVATIEIDGTPIDARETPGVSHLTFGVGGNGTDSGYDSYVDVNDPDGTGDRRVVIPVIEGGEAGDLAIPNDWLVEGHNTLRVQPGTIPCTYTGGGGSEPSVNFDDFSLEEVTLTLLGEIADGEENPFTRKFGDGTTCVAPGVVAEPFDYSFHVAGTPGATTGLAAEVDTRSLGNGAHEVTVTTESGASVSRTVRVNNAPIGAPEVSISDGAVVKGVVPTTAVTGADGGPVTGLTIDGAEPPAAETLAAGTATFAFSVGSNSIEARYGNHMLVNGHRVDLGGDWVSSAVQVKVPNHYLVAGRNEITVVTGDINGTVNNATCANRDDFTITGIALTPATGTVTPVDVAASYPMGDGTCGSSATALPEATLHFDIDGATTARSLPTLGGGPAGFGFDIGGNGADAGFDNTLVVNGNVMELGLWETTQNPARIDLPNEWLVPGVNVVEIVAGSDHGSATGGCDNYDDFTITNFTLQPATGTAVQLTKMTNAGGSRVAVPIGDGTCGNSFTGAYAWTILFEVDAPAGGLRTDIDTRQLTDGEHELRATAGAGEDAKATTRTFTTDNSAPVIVSSVPADGQRLTSSVSLDVELADVSGIAGAPEIRLDGQPIELGAELGHGLAAGAHTLEVVARDSLGNRATRTITFSSASIPEVPTDLRADLRGDVPETPEAELSATVPGAAGEQLTATFTKSDVVTPTSGYQGVASGVPSELDVAGDPVVRPRSLQPLDERVVETPSGRDVVFQRYDLPLSGSDGRPVLRWEGVIDPARVVALRSWNPARQAWVVLASARGAAAGSTVLTAPLPAAFVDAGTVHVLVTGEDPFADDLSPRDSSAQDDKDSFEDPEDYDFSLAHFTDTQYLTEGAAGGTYEDWDGIAEESDVMAAEEQAIWQAAYRDTTQWIADNAVAKKIAYTAHTGDIIENDYYDPLATGPDGRLLRPGLDEQVTREFAISSQFQGILDDHGVVNQVIAGNHDDQLGAETGPDSRFSRTFSAERYYEASRQWPAGASYHSWDEVTAPDGTVTTPGRDNQNNYLLFSAGGLDFVAVGLSYGVTNAEAAWADSVFERYHDRNGILLSHDYLAPSTSPDGRGAKFSAPDGSMLYKLVVEQNPNVFLVLAGHEHGVGTNVRTGVGATVTHDVVELLADYQFYTVPASKLFPELVDGGGNIDVDGDGDVDHAGTDRLQFGASFLRLLQFDVERSEMSVDTYSPHFDDFGATEYDIRGAQTVPRYNGAEDNMVLPVDLTSRKTSFSTDSVALFVPTEVIGTDTVAAGETASATWAGLAPGTSYGWVVTARSADGGTAVAQPGVFRTGRVGATLTASPVSVAYGAPATVRVQVAGAPDPDGTVTISEGATALGSAPVKDGVAAVTVPGGLRPGAHSLTVAYSGGDVLEPAQTTVTLTVGASAVTLTARAPSVRVGRPASVAVTVESGGPPASGTVTVREGATTLGTATVAAGSAQVALPSTLPVGTHQLTVEFTGGSGIGSAQTTVTLEVEPGRASVSARAAAVTEGTSGAVEVSVDGDGLPARGTVTVREGGTPLGTATLADGAATVRLPASLAVGSHRLTVDYSGSDVLRAAAGTVTLRVDPRVKRAAQVRATPSSAKVTAGKAVAVQVRVTAGSPTPTGQVVVLFRGEQVRSAALDAAGGASLTLRGDFGLGRRTFVVRYLGSDDVKPASDSFVVRFVKKKR